MLKEEQISTNTLGELDAVLATYNRVVLPDVRRNLRTTQIGFKWHYADYRDMHVETAEDEARKVFSRQGDIPLGIAARFRSDDGRINSLLHDLGLNESLSGVAQRMETADSVANHYVSGVPTSFEGVTLKFALEGKTGWWFMGASFDQQVAIASVLSPVLPQLSDWYYDRDKYIVEFLFTYYNAIDGGDMEAALAIFSDDPGATYVRGDEELVGLDQIREFYQRRRVLFIGKHYLKPFTITDNEAFVEGVYQGVVDFNRGRPNFRFTDHFVFRGPHVILRESTFPDGITH